MQVPHSRGLRLRLLLARGTPSRSPGPAPLVDLGTTAPGRWRFRETLVPGKCPAAGALASVARLGIAPTHVGDRPSDEVLQDLHVDVLKPVDVEAGLAGAMLAEGGQ